MLHFFSKITELKCFKQLETDINSSLNVNYYQLVRRRDENDNLFIYREDGQPASGDYNQLLD